MNRDQKGDRDAGEWRLVRNQGWFTARVIAVKQQYGLSVNRSERDAVQSKLNANPNREVTCGNAT